MEYVIDLVYYGELVGTQATANCKTAFRSAFEIVAGIPCGESTVKRNGVLLAWFKCNWRGELTQIETYRHDGGMILVKELNPRWNRWPQFAK